MNRRLGAGAVVAVGAVVLPASAAGAHGVGGRADLPLPVWLFAYAAAFALLISFVALRILWPSPRLADLASGRAVPRGVDVAVHVVGVIAQAAAVALFGVTLAAAWFGEDSVASNLAPTALYVVFWVGMQIVSVFAGDVWSRINPIATLARTFDRVGRRDPDRSTATGWLASHWPAVAGLFVFLWLELAYHEPGSTMAVGLFLGLYTGVMLLGASWFGAAWLRTADGFAVLFSLLAALAPVHRVDDRLRLRWPGAGVAEVEVRGGTLVVIMVLLGGTTFDGLSRTQWWGDIAAGRREWDLTLVNTIGLVFSIAVVTLLFLAASRAVAVLAGETDIASTETADRWVPSLIPIMFAYAMAHYFSLLVFEGQAFTSLLSDPFGWGWDLFGTADGLIDYTVVTVDQIAWVQVVAIVGGHVAGVIAAHDRAVERYDARTASRSQYPMLAVMVAYTVGGLLLLLNA